jgi:hypothetical protein
VLLGTDQGAHRVVVLVAHFWFGLALSTMATKETSCRQHALI